MPKNLKHLAAIGLLVATSMVAPSIARVDKAEALALDRTPYEQCLYDTFVYCRNTYPSGPELVQCYADGRAACDFAHGEG